MNAKRVILSRLVFVILICTVVISSCNLPSLRPTQDLVSQSQALSGDSNVPAGHGQERVEYDHHFKFHVPLGEMQVNFETKVKGFVPLNLVHIGSAPSDCDPIFLSWYTSSCLASRRSMLLGQPRFLQKMWVVPVSSVTKSTSRLMERQLMRMGSTMDGALIKSA